MTSKEWVKEQLSYTDDHWTTSDRIMLNKILKDLERLEAINEVWHKYEPTESVDINAEHLQELYEYIIYANKENSKLKNVLEKILNQLTKHIRKFWITDIHQDFEIILTTIDEIKGVLENEK